MTCSQQPLKGAWDTAGEELSCPSGRIPALCCSWRWLAMPSRWSRTRTHHLHQSPHSVIQHPAPHKPVRLESLVGAGQLAEQSPQVRLPRGGNCRGSEERTNSLQPRCRQHPKTPNSKQGWGPRPGWPHPPKGFSSLYPPGCRCWKPHLPEIRRSWLTPVGFLRPAVDYEALRPQ